MNRHDTLRQKETTVYKHAWRAQIPDSEDSDCDPCLRQRFESRKIEPLLNEKMKCTSTKKWCEAVHKPLLNKQYCDLYTFLFKLLHCSTAFSLGDCWAWTCTSIPYPSFQGNVLVSVIAVGFVIKKRPMDGKFRATPSYSLSAIFGQKMCTVWPFKSSPMLTITSNYEKCSIQLRAVGKSWPSLNKVNFT